MDCWICLRGWEDKEEIRRLLDFDFGRGRVGGVLRGLYISERIG